MRLIALIDEDEMDKIPENCRICLFWEMFKNGEEYCVGMGHQRIYADEPLRPDYCPLRPLPERKEEMDYLAAGYNKCLDDILEDE